MSEVLNVFRNENKYIISKYKMSNIKNDLNVILKKDLYSNNKSYKVRSLYFDSINNIDFNTKLAGTLDRKKIRIRSYDVNDNKCKLEMKKKHDDLSNKISVWINKDDVNELIKGNYKVLIKYFNENKDIIDIYNTMQLGLYRPVVMVEYDRLAYFHPLYNTRITFDYNIKSSESNFDLFDKKINYTKVFNDYVVLEVKYNKKLLGFISDILKKQKLTMLSISKYCISRKVFYDFNY